MNSGNIKIKECPNCGGRDFGEGYQRGHAKLVTSVFDLSGDNLNHLVCVNCGMVVASYVKHPERFNK